MKVLRIVLAALLVIGVLLLIPHFASLTVADILSYKPEYPIVTALIILALYCLKAVLQFIPLSVLYIATGIMYPDVPAVLFTAFCLFCEMSIGYFLGKKTGSNGVLKLIEKHPKAGIFFDLVNDHGSTACFLTRLIPIPIPLDIVSMFFGASGVPYARYISFSLLGISAKMIPWVVAAGAITSPLSPQFIIPFLLCFLVSGGTFAVYLVMSRRKKKRLQAEGAMEDIEKEGEEAIRHMEGP